MVRFPKAPDTLVTLQIECVSCRELFTLAEDAANATTLDSWRMPTNGPGQTEMHPRPPQTHRLVRPLTLSKPEQDENSWEYWEEKKETAVNCPRCGTDNRNWLRLSYAPHPGNKLERFWDILNRFSLTWLSIAVTLFLLLRLLLREWDNEYLFTYALMFVIIILGTVIPITAITGQWRKERLHKIITKFDKTIPWYKSLSPAWGQGILYFGLFVFVIPTVVYILLPWVTGAFQNEKPLTERIDQALVALDDAAIQDLVDNHSNELAPANNALISLQGLIPSNLFLCDPAAIDTTLTNLEAMNMQNLAPETAVLIENASHHLEQLKTQAANGSCDPQTVINAVQPLSTLNADTWQACITASAAYTATNPVCNDPAVVTIIAYLQNAGDPGAIFLGTLPSKIRYTLQEARTLALQTNDPNVLARIENDVTTLEKAIKRANDGPDTLPGTATMLNTWLKYVGLSCLTAVITAVVATQIYTGKISRHLPQPLSYSLSRLTRVVLWEARHTLEINGHFDHIEWNEAYRTIDGGITLRGHLCPPTTTSPPEKYVRAMCYTLRSDLWGHIIFAEAKSVRVSPSIIQEWHEHEKETKDNLNKLFVNAE